MPDRLPKSYEAIARMVSRLVICGEMRENFRGRQKFTDSFEHYFARKAVRPHQRDLAELMDEPYRGQELTAEEGQQLDGLMNKVPTAVLMERIHRRLDVHKLKPPKPQEPKSLNMCWWDYRRPPRVFKLILICGIAVLVSSLVSLLPFFLPGLRPGTGARLAAGLVGALVALILLWDAFYYERL